MFATLEVICILGFIFLMITVMVMLWSLESNSYSHRLRLVELKQKILVSHGDFLLTNCYSQTDSRTRRGYMHAWVLPNSFCCI